MSSLAQIQSAFTAALFDPAAMPPFPLRGARDARRFAVYRNNVAAGLISALASRYPAVKRLVGNEFFGEMARAYAAAEPPRSPILLHYGESFPAFIDAFAPARPIPYLGDVARLEWARGAAYHAADVEPVGVAAFSALTPDGLGALRVKLHPSVSVIRSRFPVYGIWKVNQNRAAVAPVSPWAPESVLVARPHNAVQVQPLAPGQGAFLATLNAGETFTRAVDAGASETRAFDTAGSLALLITGGLVARFA